jgi:cell pole-organizing protein PopZ
VTSAFEALSASLAARGAEIAEGMAREMLRPMLKAWLDENLPGIVERLVRAEIERVARGIR